jgi:hypothetical protein
MTSAGPNNHLQSAIADDGSSESKRNARSDDKNHQDLIERRAGSDSDEGIEWTAYPQPPALGLKQLFSNGKL